MRGSLPTCWAPCVAWDETITPAAVPGSDAALPSGSTVPLAAACGPEGEQPRGTSCLGMAKVTLDHRLEALRQRPLLVRLTLTAKKARPRGCAPPRPADPPAPHANSRAMEFITGLVALKDRTMASIASLSPFTLGAECDAYQDDGADAPRPRVRLDGDVSGPRPVHIELKRPEALVAGALEQGAEPLAAPTEPLGACGGRRRCMPGIPTSCHVVIEPGRDVELPRRRVDHAKRDDLRRAAMSCSKSALRSRRPRWSAGGSCTPQMKRHARPTCPPWLRCAAVGALTSISHWFCKWAKSFARMLATTRGCAMPSRPKSA